MNYYRSFVPLLLGPLLAFATADAYAQNVTGAADAGRVESTGQQPTLLTPSDEVVSVQRPTIASAPEGADKITFQLHSLNVQGVTIYPDSKISSFYAGKLGQTLSVADVYEIAAAMTRKYRNDGYILTQVIVPPQTIDSGDVTLQVVEGTVGDVSVEGIENPRETKFIDAYVRTLQNKVLNTEDLEQVILLTNDLPGVSARVVISPSPDKPGAANLRVIAQRKQYEGLLAVDNYGGRYLGPVRGEVAGSTNSFFGFNERLTADVVYAPDNGLKKELAFGTASYYQPFGAYGANIEFRATYASTRPGYNLEEFDAHGRSLMFSVKVGQPVIRTRSLNWSLYGQVDTRESENDTNVTTTTHDHIRAIRLGTDISVLDGFLGGGYNSINLEASHGIDIFQGSEPNDPNLSRTDGDPTFAKFNLEAQRLQRVTQQVNVLFGAQGQLSNGPQLSAEEFGFGGPSYGRGYDPSEIIGDEGIAGKAEVQYNPEPLSEKWLKANQFYAFVDAGRVWNDDATTSDDKQISAVSAGVGVRTTLKSDTEAGMFVAKPLTRDVATEDDRSPRFYFNLRHRF